MRDQEQIENGRIAELDGVALTPEPDDDPRLGWDDARS